ncbi:MAG: circadian clock protein KaiC [Cyanophyceae cyanobacterium]
MSTPNELELLKKVQTGIPGFDLISLGGLPKGRTSLVTGTAGTGKTIFACQFLVEGIKRGQNGVFVTFEEPPAMVRKNVRGFGWNIEQWEEEGKWAIVDATAEDFSDLLISGDYDLGALLARIQYAINQVDAQRISLDSISSILSYVPDRGRVRRDLFRISAALRELDITAVLTAERTDEYGQISSYGVEEFVADNVIILRHVLAQERRRRTVEILKYRGTEHQGGEFPFTILPDRGIVVIPFSAKGLIQTSSVNRITSGNAELDQLCGGGFFRETVVLVSGATGTGKTLMATEFLVGGITSNERSLLLAFEENRQQLIRNAANWGVNFEQMEQEGLLKVICRSPEEMGLESHFVRMREEIEEFKPQRVALDSISALENASTIQGFREFLLTLSALLKERGITGFLTCNTATLTGGASITQNKISTSTDLIILLRYIEIYGEIRRGLTVLKMRGSAHDKGIREYTIDDQGMHLGQPFRNVSGILSGNPTSTSQNEIDRLSSLLEENE